MSYTVKTELKPQMKYVRKIAPPSCEIPESVLCLEENIVQIRRIKVKHGTGVKVIQICAMQKAW